MKKNIIYILLLIIIGSCTGINQGNFNKRKYLNLKLKPTNNKSNKEQESIVLTTSISDLSNDVSLTNADKKVEELLTPTTSVNNSINTHSEDIKNSPQPMVAQDVILIESKQATTNAESALDIKRHATKDITQLSQKKGKSGLLYFSILLAVPFMLKSKKGKRISKWASKNGRKAQLLIGVLGITGISSSYALGNILKLDINVAMISAPLVLGAIAVGIYKYKGTRKKKFIKDRLSFALLNIATFFGSFAAGSNATHSLSSLFSDSPAETALDPALAGLIILGLIAVLAASIFGLLWLACAIACMWAPILGIIVLFTGSILAIVFTVIAIKAIIMKTKTKTKQKKEHNKPIIANLILQTILIGLGLINYFVWL